MTGWRNELFRRRADRATIRARRVQIVARFLCEHDGVNPDALIPDDVGGGKSPAWHSFKVQAADLLARL